jgi:hypothetical protein
VASNFIKATVAVGRFAYRVTSAVVRGTIKYGGKVLVKAGIWVAENLPAMWGASIGNHDEKAEEEKNDNEDDDDDDELYAQLLSNGPADMLKGLMVGGGGGGGRSGGGRGGKSIYRQGKFPSKTWGGNKIKGTEWAPKHPLRTSEFPKKYGLPAENSGRPDWVIRGNTGGGNYRSGPAPGSYNRPENIGGARQVVPADPNDVNLDWFHMP